LKGQSSNFAVRFVLSTNAIMTGYKIFLLLMIFAASCTSPKKNKTTSAMPNKKTGSIQVIDPMMNSLVDTGYGIEILAEGFDWSEGPLWIENGNYLLFSDIPPNKIMKWSEAKGLETYLHPSGYTGTLPRGGEPGSNGLILDNQGRLVLCQHGDRRMARMDAPLDKPAARFITLADMYDGKRFNSPNDAVYHSNGDLYFTDPPYGLVKNMEDPAKEIPFQGIYRLKKSGEVELLSKELSRPNGIAFSPDEKKLYVGNSDRNRIWMVWDITADGGVTNGKIFYDASNDADGGAPDGMKVDKSGNIFSTGPGGVVVFDAHAKLLGKIKVGQACSNVAFDTNHKFLYITADGWLVRVKLI
jgi:gluconolactonase